MNTDAINFIFGVIGAIGTILGVIGLVLTVRSIRKKEPVYSIKSNNLISGSASTLENLNVSYKAIPSPIMGWQKAEKLDE